MDAEAQGEFFNLDDAALEEERMLAQYNERFKPGAYRQVFFPPASGQWKIDALFPEGFFESAKLLLGGVVSGRLNESVEGVAAIFLSRHYLELAIKYVLFHSRWLQDEKQNAAAVAPVGKTHNLEQLWTDLVTELKRKPGVVPKGLDLDFVAEFVAEFNKFDGTIVVPNAYTNSPGGTNGTEPSSPVSIVNQTLSASNQFPGPIEITGMFFRADPGFGPVNFDLSSGSIYLSTSPNTPSTMSTTFANNIGPDNTLVFSGTNIAWSDAGCSGSGVCPFDLGVSFTTPFYYNPANGSLLVEVVGTGFTGSGSTDAVSFGGPGGGIARVTATGSTTAPTGTLAYGNTITEFTFTAVPEPASLAITAAGSAALLWLGRRQRSGRRGRVAVWLHGSHN